MLREYDDEDLCLHLKFDQDENVELIVDPVIEEITKQDLIDLYRNVLNYKPKQFPVGTYKKSYCDDCAQDFVIYKKQVFCPRCFKIHLDDEPIDANEAYERLIGQWLDRKKCIEEIINGDVIQFVNSYNDYLKDRPEGIITDDFMGEEVIVKSVEERGLSGLTLTDFEKEIFVNDDQ